jgi:hypothetical protein
MFINFYLLSRGTFGIRNFLSYVTCAFILCDYGQNKGSNIHILLLSVVPQLPWDVLVDACDTVAVFVVVITARTSVYADSVSELT